MNNAKVIMLYEIYFIQLYYFNNIKAKYFFINVPKTARLYYYSYPELDGKTFKQKYTIGDNVRITKKKTFDKGYTQR